MKRSMHTQFLISKLHSLPYHMQSTAYSADYIKNKSDRNSVETVCAFRRKKRSKR